MKYLLQLSYTISSYHYHYFPFQKKNINIVTTAGEYLTKIKISKMEDMLEQQRFARVHRSFIINLDKVTAFKTTVLELQDWKVPIGNTYINLLKTLLPKSSL